MCHPTAFNAALDAAAKRSLLDHTREEADVLRVLFRSRRNAQSRAWVKVGYVFFVVGAIYAIVRPNDTTVVAHWLGIGRGADLLLYALVIAFLFTTISAYTRFKDLELRYAQLARAVALEGARVPEPDPPTRQV